MYIKAELRKCFFLFVPLGVPDEYIEKGRDAKVTTEIAQNGDSFVITRIRPAGTTSNTLTLGQESELDTIKGDKIKVCMAMFVHKLKRNTVSEINDIYRITLCVSFYTRYALISGDMRLSVVYIYKEFLIFKTADGVISDTTPEH